MDISSTKATSVLDSLTASIDAGGEQDGGSENIAASFSSILKNNSESMGQTSNKKALSAILSRTSQAADHTTVEGPKSHDEALGEQHEPRQIDDRADSAPEAPRQHHDHDDVQAVVETDDTVYSDDGGQGAELDGQPDTENSANQSHSDNGDEAERAAGPQADESAEGTDVSDEVAAGTQNVADNGALQDVVEEAITGSQSAVQASTVTAAATGNTGKATQNANTTVNVDESKTPEIVQQAANATPKNSPKSQVTTPSGSQTQEQTGTQLADGKSQSSNAAAQIQQTVQKNTQGTHNLGQNQTNQANEGAVAAAKGQETKGSSAQSAATAQQQAQDLSKKLGGDARVDVKVTVDEESAKLTSRPGASLAQGAQDAAAKSSHQTPQGQQVAQPQQQAGAQVNIQAAVQQQATQSGQAGLATQTAIAQAGGGQATSAIAGAEGASSTSSTLPGTASSQLAQQMQTAAKEPAAKPHPHNQRAAVDQVSVQITKALKANADSIRIQMKPASLGRVDIHLEMSDGKVSATVVADSKETLEMLQRGSKDLARALSSAGLNADSDSLSYNLREQGGNQQQAHGNAKNDGRLDFANGADTAPEVVTTGEHNNIISEERIDIRA